MTAVTVTATIGATCHYWITPQPDWDASGPNVLDVVHGWIAEGVDPAQPFSGPLDDQTPVSLSLALDDSVLWNVRMEFRGAAPLLFDGLDVTGGGDLFDMLAAQDWMHL